MSVVADGSPLNVHSKSGSFTINPMLFIVKVSKVVDLFTLSTCWLGSHGCSYMSSKT
jgi:hypothetical protein